MPFATLVPGPWRLLWALLLCVGASRPAAAQRAPTTPPPPAAAAFSVRLQQLASKLLAGGAALEGFKGSGITNGVYDYRARYALPGMPSAEYDDVSGGVLFYRSFVPAAEATDYFDRVQAQIRSALPDWPMTPGQMPADGTLRSYVFTKEVTEGPAFIFLRLSYNATGGFYTVWLAGDPAPVKPKRRSPPP